ncbi:quinolinate phosphoribosyl transferase, partial [Listeria ivanovii FSL F6-596]
LDKLGHMVNIEVETETASQVTEAVQAGADIIMFDNRSPEEIKELVKLVPAHITTEASGNITTDNIASYKGCGVNYISLGFLTHSVCALDISFNNKGGMKS